ncbi:MAG: YncE family protein [Nitrospiraceae bacterium]|nr:MAG: YncE family protein [Nitrospiraceae bacterium]
MNKLKQSIINPTLVFLVMLMLAVMKIGCANFNKLYTLQPAKLYVANEDGGSVSVIDLQNSRKNTIIDLTDSQGEMYMAHNVQTAPDGKSVWVTAVPMDSSKAEQLVVIGSDTGTIKKRIQLGKHLHVAHVVLDNESKNAFVTTKDSSQVFQVNAATYEVVRRFDLGKDNAPHGMRYFNGKLYVASMGSKSLSIVNVADGQIRDIPLQGMAVQTGVTQDGKFVFVSLYDTKEVARYDLLRGQITKIPLPEGSQGPIQLYATPDSKLLYVCDQGELLQRPVSDKVYVIDISYAKVINTIKVGNKAHGVVVSRDGKAAYVTNTSDNTISIIDVITQKVTGTVPVGKGPNGISYWFATGGMP